MLEDQRLCRDRVPHRDNYESIPVLSVTIHHDFKHSLVTLKVDRHDGQPGD